ncbi:hypothetical protein HWV62_1418 [Athelia sp. TMB]|nr:hypothetical protein HWV62_1418 [Athelia sp. TMB]
MARRPSLKADPDAWERSWQRELAHTYPAHLTCLPSRVSDLQPLAALMLDPRGRGRAAARFKEVCDLQADLTKMAAEKCTIAGFEGEWRRSAPGARKRHYIAAMLAVCELPDMENQRTYAPEVTLAAFEAGSGQGYLDILRKLIAFDSSNSFVHLENPLIESMLGIEPPVDTSGSQPSDPMVHLQKSAIANRTLFITLVVWNILLSFYGESETLLQFKATKEPKVTPAEMAVFNDFGATSDSVAAARKEIMKNRKTAQSRCNACGKLQIELANVPFKSCAKCLAAGAYTRYCSRECQVADWKTGTPPHRTVCGQPDALLAAPQAPATRREWEPAAPGFRRSPALLHQMRLLDENPSIDYFFVQPYPLNDYGVTIPNLVDKLVFLVGRSAAVNSGDARLLKVMYYQLAPYVKLSPGMSLELWRKQLLDEYGVDVEKIIP